MNPPPRRGGGSGSGGGDGAYARVRTPGYAQYNMAWSPFYENKLAVAGASNYGLVGNGRLHIMHFNAVPRPGARLGIEKFYDTQDGLYDVAWSEVHENQLATASGDGSIKLWDMTLNDHPIRNWAEHSREVFSLDWNNIKKELFASSSWDASIRIWHPERPTSLLAITAHTGCVYGCAWSPHNADLIATACGDGQVRLFDLRQGGGAGGPGVQRPVATVPVGGEVLCLDWNKYLPMTLATGSTDRAVKVWDLRGTTGGGGVAGAFGEPPLPGQGAALQNALMGHEYAVRCVNWSPHSSSLLASASYDMTARVWDTAVPATPGMNIAGTLPPGGPNNRWLRKIHDGHTEFVAGVAWALFQEGVIASCAWDCETQLW